MNLLQKLSVAVACGATVVAGFVAFIYAQPGKTMQIKWKRSYRKMRRFSKELMKSPSTNIVPMMQNFISVMQFLLERLPQ